MSSDSTEIRVGTSNSNVATSMSPDLTVGLHGHATTRVVEHKRLMRETKLPRQTSVLDASPPRSASTTIATGNEDVVRLHLSEAVRDDADSHF